MTDQQTFVFDNMTGDEIVEHGIGMVARGLMRKADKDGPREAAGCASTAVSVIRSIWFDLERNAAAVERKPVSP